MSSIKKKVLIPSIALLFIFSYPFWIASCLKPIFNALNIHFESLQNDGYHGLALKNLSFENDDFAIQIDRASLPPIHTYLWGLLWGLKDHSPHIPIHIQTLQVQIKHAPPSSISDQSNPSQKQTVFNVIQTVYDVFDVLESYLPETQIERALFSIQNETLLIKEVIWKNTILTLQMRHAQVRTPFYIQCNIPEVNALTLIAELPIYSTILTSHFSLSEKDLQIDASIKEEDAKIELISTFDRTQNIPIDFKIETQNFHVPIALSDENLNFSFHIQGNPENISIEKFQITSNWIKTEIDSPYTFHWNDLNPNSLDSHFEADLEKLSSLPFAGNIRGKVSVLPQGTDLPHVEFSFASNNFQIENIRVPRLIVKGDLRWPILSLRFDSSNPEAESQLKFKFQFDFDRDYIDAASIDIQLSRSIIADIFLAQEDFSCSSISLQSSMHGSWNSLLENDFQQITHQGSCTIQEFISHRSQEAKILDSTKDLQDRDAHTQDIIIEGTIHQPVTEITSSPENAEEYSTDIAIQWQGKGLDLSLLELDLQNPLGSIRSVSQTHLNGNLCTISLSKLDLDLIQQTPFHLEKASQIEWNTENNLFSFDTLSLINESNALVNLSASLQPNVKNHLFISIKDLHLDPILTFFPQLKFPIPITIDSLSLLAKWDADAPLDLELDSSFSYLLNDKVVHFIMNSRTKPGHLSANARTYFDSTHDLFSLNMFIPLSVYIGKRNPFEFNIESPLQIDLFTDPQLKQWSILESYTGLHFDSPTIHFNVSGSLEKPIGQFEFSAESFIYKSSRFSASNRFKNPTIHIQITPEMIEVEDLTFYVQEQPITGKGRWNLNAEEWKIWIQEHTIPAFNEAQFKISGRNISLIEFSNFLPQAIRPNGEMSVELELQHQKKLTGSIDISHSSTFPIPLVGAIQNIDVHANLKNSILNILTCSGEIGGKPLSTEGFIDFHSITDPLFNCKIQGEDIPILRSTGILLRGNVDLYLKSRANKTTELMGNIVLTKGFVLLDLPTLSHSIGGSAKPPPYFSIAEEPFAQWDINIHIAGKNFLQVNTPIFLSKLSCDFQLDGTFKDPIAYGHMEINQGRITFPFASLKVNSGKITIDKQNPKHVNLDISASGRTHSYDIGMSISGSAVNPNILFNASPSLDSATIINMVTTGKSPESDADSVAPSFERLGTLGVFLGKNILPLHSSGNFESRLKFSVGEDITESGRETIEASYKMTPRLSIMAKYDVFDDFNLDLKYKIYAK